MTLESYYSEMIQTRRTIHRRPEEGWTEFETTWLVVKRLRELGWKVQCGRAVISPEHVMGRDEALVTEAISRSRAAGVPEEFLSELAGYTGAVAELDTGRPGPVTAFRCDLDCVCVEETKDPQHEANVGGYASTIPGHMHACGHDGHVAVALALARWAADHRDELCGRIKLVFQPAEEGVRGALPLSESGVIDDVDILVCSHIGSSCRLGEAAVSEKGFLATTKIDANFTGISAHAGVCPERGRSALLAACSCATLLSGISRTSEGDSRITVGTLRAGEGRNVVPVHAAMQIETRGENESVNRFMTENVFRIIEGTAKTFDVQCSIRKVGEATNLVADHAITEELAAIAAKAPGIRTVLRCDDVKASEDCTILGRRVREHGGKMGYFMFGCDQKGHHRGDFEIQDEESLPPALFISAEFLKLKNSRK